MSVSTNAILFGKITHADIIPVLKKAFPHISDDFKVAAEGDGITSRLVFPEPFPVSEKDASHRNLYIFDGSISDHLDIYDGSRTLLNLNHWGSAVEIMKALLDQFGGYLLERDGVEWQLYNPTPASEPVDMTAKDRLKIKLAAIIPPKAINLIDDVINNDVALNDLTKALNEYRDETLEDIPGAPKI